jgi:uncharacterized membrane protein
MTPQDRLPAAALAGQCLLQIAWHAWLAPPPTLKLAIVVLALLPMLALIPAALHSTRRMLLVGGIVSLLYFCHGVMEAWSNPSVRMLASAEVAFAMIAVFGLRKSSRKT